MARIRCVYLTLSAVKCNRIHILVT
ncbi:hypothetical protein VCHENC02_3315A, partial [Vibrio harveyi]